MQLFFYLKVPLIITIFGYKYDLYKEINERKKTFMFFIYLYESYFMAFKKSMRIGFGRGEGTMCAVLFFYSNFTPKYPVYP